MSEFLVSLLGERLVNSEKAEVDVQSLGAKLSLVGLFFGCSLNAPCKQFNGSLCEFYSRFKKTSEHKDKLEIVFISSDQDQKHWQDFLQEMPWPALPFKDRHKKGGVTHGGVSTSVRTSSASGRSTCGAAVLALPYMDSHVNQLNTHQLT
ncbi:Nucleoredoxin [Collichthys lucidus]|uniref:Nucleoredoxin n=1 Tax=Collichthys lucidus TaxID=240159 RepID=A0A4U5V052_COLLU|nr:Nucleoredoxin [Collichthys lucidus]